MKKRQPKRPLLSEAQLRKIIFDELVDQYLVQEGVWDDVKSGAQKLSAYVTKQFKQVSGQWAKAIVNASSKLTEIPPEAKKVLQVLKHAMQETSETFQMDQGLQDAKELGQINKDAALAVVQKDLEGPVHEKAKAAETKAEGKHLPGIYNTLAETQYVNLPKEKLNEFGVIGAAGVGLAIMGGLPLLFKGLGKLANVLGAHGTAELFHKAEHVTHHFEQKAVDFAMPFRLAYAVYLGLWKMGIKLTKGEEPLNEIEIKAEDEGKKAIMQVKGLIYKVLLIYFAINGISGVLHAGASLLGFVEGTATTVKGIELARGAEEIAKLVRAGSGGLAV